MASLSYGKAGKVEGRQKYKVRWREWATVDGERKRVARSATVVGEAARDELMVAVRRALDTLGYYEPEARPEEQVCDLEHAAAAWLRWKAGQGVAATTIVKSASVMRTFFRDAREVLKLKQDAVVPGNAMSIDLMARVRLVWQARGLAPSTSYLSSGAILDMWRYAYDEEWPGVPKPPLLSKRALPRCPPASGAATPPTWAECDAICRRARDHAQGRGADDLPHVAATMRYTGLRICQVLGVHGEDIDLAHGTLRVRVGKSAAEKEEQRVIPVSWHLVEYLQPLIDARGTGPLFPTLVRGGRPKGRANSEEPMGMLWERATADGEVRREVWAPPNRRHTRPHHAFRAAFMDGLERLGVRDPVIDRLVGHRPATVRGKSYVPPREDELRAAVDLIPPIDWLGAEADDADNVIPLR